MESIREQSSILYIIFIDVKKAFDTINSKAALWMCFRASGCHQLQLIQLLYHQTTGSVLGDTGSKEKFNKCKRSIQ